MTKGLIWGLALVCAPVWFASAACGAPRIKCIKVAVENPTADARPASDVVIPIADLRKIAPDFTPAAVVVTASAAATLEQDAATMAASELPSQVDALATEGKGDELAFQIDLKPHQTRIVTISYGDLDRIWRLRSDYPRRTDALFSNRFQGLGWENDRNGFRIYFDQRNAIDMFGKRRPTLQLRMYALPDYPYHEESPEGRDTYRIGDALGIGSLAALVDGKLEKVAEVKDRRWRVMATGPVRSIVELAYAGWNIAGRSVTAHARITIWAGEYGFEQAVTLDDPLGGVLVTGVPRKQGVPMVKSEPSSANAVAWLATWGEQVVNPGSAESGTVPGANIGLAVVLPGNSAAGFEDDAANHLIRLNLDQGKASWYVMAAWDQNGTNRLVGTGNRAELGTASSYVLPPDGIATRDAFLATVRDQAARMAGPVKVTIASAAAAPQSAPADTLGSPPAKTYAQALELLRAEIDRTAEKWQGVIAAQPRDGVSSDAGAGFFTEADNLTGEWKPQKGYAWTGSFWIAELWKMYARTHDEKYRRWAELWGTHLAGQEMKQTHDAGFLYFYGAALGFELTGQQALRESAFRAAERLEQLYNPRTHLITSWEPGGDETIIDTMMNLQLLWWASHQTEDAQKPKIWRDMALNHALRSAEWFIRPDGSVIQSVHYNPGDNRQEFDLAGGPSHSRPSLVRIPNQAAVGERVFNHNHQGYAADTSWSRGTGWALYGFGVAYAETREPRLLAAAEGVADFALDNLPEDGVPWYDLYDEGVHFRNRDTSAAAIVAGGLLRLSVLTSDAARARVYREQAERIVHSLVDRYLTPVGAEDRTPGGVLRHGSTTRPNDAMVIYGHYYLLEDLLWLEEHGEPQKTPSMK